MYTIIEKLSRAGDLTDAELIKLLESKGYERELFQAADRLRRDIYGTDVYIRGLIELTNYCKNNCYYCGIRYGNKNVTRYRLSHEDVLTCCENGFELGFRTFVIQGGEDAYFTRDIICAMIKDIKARFPSCAVTLSLGEKPYESYKAFRQAGADRYLLRHETACDTHYRMLHPNTMRPDKRRECLINLKKLGYQVGSGFMVGSPYQTMSHIVKDIRFLQNLRPEMIGIGPYITHKDTPMACFESGGLELTLKLIAIIRLMFPSALIPSTTALGTISPNGRELGLKCGANVVMPNLSPVSIRKYYSLYDGKIYTGEESAECVKQLKMSIEAAGYSIVVHRGDAKTPGLVP